MIYYNLKGDYNETINISFQIRLWEHTTMSGKDDDGYKFFLFVDADYADSVASQFTKNKDVKSVKIHNYVCPTIEEVTGNEENKSINIRITLHSYQEV
jgi:hypothetical protein